MRGRNAGGALMRSAGDRKMHASRGAPRKERGVQRANARSQCDAPAQVLGSSGVLMRRSQAHGWRMARQACVYARQRTGTVVAGFKVCSAPVRVDMNHHQAAGSPACSNATLALRARNTSRSGGGMSAHPQTRDGGRASGGREALPHPTLSSSPMPALGVPSLSSPRVSGLGCMVVRAAGL